ncbi:hypothetical protein [Methylocella sp.]|uniref:hypothetical protein n=1 Tax=Methylocella sp. TaxID=1978226 RepID=UPI003783A0E8
MQTWIDTLACAVCSLALAMLFVCSAQADPNEASDASDLAKKLQNPIGGLISVPFQSNTNFNYGLNRGPKKS